MDKSQNINVSVEDRCRLTKMVMKLFRLWEISSEDKLKLDPIPVS
jgi:hypothetical protein